MDFDQLALETFELKGDFQGKNPFYEESRFANDDQDDQENQNEETHLVFDLFADESFEYSEELTAEMSEMLYPRSSGVIYRIDRGGSTFCLRGMACADLAQSFEHFKKNEAQILKALRLESFTDDQEVFFFETDTFEAAEVLSDQYFKRRLPLNEEMVCNLSDPGFSWWFCEKEDGFLLSFKTTGFHDNKDLINLGPIGDRKIASQILRTCESYFSEVLKQTEMSCSEKAFQVQSSEKDHLFLKELRDLFLKGEYPSGLEKFFETKQNKTLGLYFGELAVLRSFWIELQGQLFPYS